MKQQTSLADLVEYRHTLNADITSQTFVDASFRFASHKDGLTASMSSPPSGFLGLQFQQRSPSQLYGKLFSRYPSTPEKDTDVLTAKATLRNAQKLILQTSWNWDFFNDVIEGTKDRIPAMTDAVLKFINKYHIAHFGFDLNRGGMKLKNTVSNVIERAYHESPMSFTTLQNSIQHLCDAGKDMYMKASDSLMSMSVQNVMDTISSEVRQDLKYCEDKIDVLLDAVTQFLSDTEFTMPGSDETLSSLEMFQQAERSVSQGFSSLLEKISRYIRGIRFTIPGNDVVVNGNEIMQKCMSFMRSLFDQLRHLVHRGVDFIHKTVEALLQVFAYNMENFISNVKDKNVESASQVNTLYAEVLQSSNQYTEEAKRYVAEYKDQAKLNIQRAYNALSMEQVNNNAKECINILQSHLHRGLNGSIDLMKQASQSTAPYLEVGDKKVDIEIPLPFHWKSFSEWPKKSSQ